MSECACYWFQEFGSTPKNSQQRKSKANRSFEYATQLLAMGIGTPEPIAFLEKYDSNRSFEVF